MNKSIKNKKIFAAHFIKMKGKNTTTIQAEAESPRIRTFWITVKTLLSNKGKILIK